MRNDIAASKRVLVWAWIALAHSFACSCGIHTRRPDPDPTRESRGWIEAGGVGKGSGKE